MFSSLFLAVAFFADAEFFSKMNTWGSRELGNTPAEEGQTHLFYYLTQQFKENKVNIQLLSLNRLGFKPVEKVEQK